MEIFKIRHKVIGYLISHVQAEILIQEKIRTKSKRKVGTKSYLMVHYCRINTISRKLTICTPYGRYDTAQLKLQSSMNHVNCSGIWEIYNVLRMVGLHNLPITILTVSTIEVFGRNWKHPTSATSKYIHVCEKSNTIITLAYCY